MCHHVSVCVCEVRRLVGTMVPRVYDFGFYLHFFMASICKHSKTHRHTHTHEEKRNSLNFRVKGFNAQTNCCGLNDNSIEDVIHFIVGVVSRMHGNEIEMTDSIERTKKCRNFTIANKILIIIFFLSSLVVLFSFIPLQFVLVFYCVACDRKNKQTYK